LSIKNKLNQRKNQRQSLEPNYHQKSAPIRWQGKLEGGIRVNKKNGTNRVMTVVSSVMPHREKQASVIFYFIDGGAR
jgi:hypothetical protein